MSTGVFDASSPAPVSAPRESLRSQMSRFFFAEEAPYGVALVRMAMPIGVLMATLPRWPWSRELYSTDGAPSPLWTNFGFPDLLPEPSGTMAVAMMTLLSLSLVTLMIGWCSRTSAVISTVLFVYLNLLDSTSTITKYTCVAAHYLLLLSCADCGAVWSVDAWMRNRRTRAQGLPVSVPLSAAWPRRLMQIAIGVIYLGAAITKYHTPSFFTGEQLQTWLLTHLNLRNPMGELLSLAPALIVVSAYVTIVWETLFLFVSYRGWGRTCMLGLGVIFHAGTFFLLGLDVFPAICVATYFAFINEDDVQRWAPRFARLKARLVGSSRPSVAPVHVPAPILGRVLQLPSAAVFTVVATVVIVGGIEVEHWMDPYGIRRPEGPYALRELDPEHVRQLLQPAPRVREKDKIFSVETGTFYFGGVLANRRNKFSHGEQIIVQCTMNPPFEDLWLECELRGAKGSLVDRVGQVVTRDLRRANFTYDMVSTLAPGQYSFVIKSGGEPVAQRNFTLEAAVASPVAN